MSVIALLIIGALRLVLLLVVTLVAIGLFVAIIALPFALVTGALGRAAPRPPSAPLYVAKETTMPAFLSMISYTLLVALMLGIGLGWIGGL